MRKSYRVACSLRDEFDKTCFPIKRTLLRDHDLTQRPFILERLLLP